MKEINDLQRRRASNIIWSFAGRYDFVPDFRAYDNEGMADMYFNCIIGAARRYFDYEKIEQEYQILKNLGDANGMHLLPIAMPDEYVEHGNVEILKKETGIDADTIVNRIIVDASLANKQ